LAAVPAVLKLLLASAQRASAVPAALRAVLVTGTRLPRGLREEFQRRFGVPVYNYYGLTETAGFCAGDLPGGDTPGPDSIGAEVDALFRIAGPRGEEVLPGGHGELWVQSANLFSGYWEDPEATARACSGRWFRTGDIVRREPGGTLTLVGRRGEIVKTAAGDLLSAAELEGALLAEPAVEDACVVRARESGEEERFVAYVVPSCHVAPEGEASWKQRVVASLSRRLGPGRVPADLKLLRALPRGSSGKVALADLEPRGDRT
jgi:acyl-coenzyme A synthetase/AMP-(fatty) acid ligase